MTRRLRFLGCAGLLAWLPLFAALPTAAQPAPDLDELRDARFSGIEGLGEVTLVDGVWEGTPPAPGGATRPSVSLVPGFRRVGDLDGDGVPEAVVLLAARGGGTGENLHLAVVDRDGDRLVNTATARVGDRVQVRGGQIEADRIVLDVVQAGPGDPACCPGELVTRAWALRGSRLEELPATRAGRLSPEALAGEEWVLRGWSPGEDAPAEPEVTLAFEDGRFAGSSGCNRYSAAVTAGRTPSDVSLGPAVGTRMACPEPIMEVEARFLAALAGARKLGFLAGRLALTTETDGVPGTLLFARRGEDEAGGDEAAALDPEAMAIAARMAERLSGAERLSVRVDASYDALQQGGQTVEFGGRREVTLRRPDRLRVAVTDRSLGRRLLVYDGREISYWDEANNAWASTPRTGSLDDTLDYLVDDLGASLPLSELISTRLAQTLEEVTEASYVGIEDLGGVECDHLVFRNDAVGFQIWVARRGEPVPRRIVIDYEHAEGRPQFRADLSRWDLSPRTPESLFAFEPPDGAERISFLPRRRQAAEEVR